MAGWMTRRLVAAGMLLFAVSGCRRAYEPVELAPLLAGPEPVRVACLGDSLTQNGGTNSYPAILQRLLGSAWEVRNYGMGSATVLHFGDYPYTANDNIDRAVQWAPHVIVLLLGTNDSKPRHWYYKKDFIRDYRAIIRKLKQTRGRPAIWVAYPLPAFPGQWGIRDEVIREEMIPVLRELAVKEGLPVMDTYTPFREHPEMFPDQIHPDERGRALLAEIVGRELLAAVEGGGSR